MPWAVRGSGTGRGAVWGGLRKGQPEEFGGTPGCWRGPEGLRGAGLGSPLGAGGCGGLGDRTWRGLGQLWNGHLEGFGVPAGSCGGLKDRDLEGLGGHWGHPRVDDWGGCGSWGERISRSLSCPTGGLGVPSEKNSLCPLGESQVSPVGSPPVPRCVLGVLRHGVPHVTPSKSPRCPQAPPSPAHTAPCPCGGVPSPPWCAFVPPQMSAYCPPLPPPRCPPCPTGDPLPSLLPEVPPLCPTVEALPWCPPVPLKCPHPPLHPLCPPLVSLVPPGVHSIPFALSGAPPGVPFSLCPDSPVPPRCSLPPLTLMPPRCPLTLPFTPRCPLSLLP